MEGQLLISLFSIEPLFLLRLEIDRLLSRCCQSVILAIFAHENRYASFLHGVFENPSCYFVSD